MTPEELLYRHPRETLPWLRRRLALTRPAFAAWLGVATAAVGSWERGARPIPPVFRLRLAPHVARYLASAQGQDNLREIIAEGER